MKKINLLFLIIVFIIAGTLRPGTVKASQRHVINDHSHTGALSDTHIKYFGRWDFSDTSQYVSYWGGAYFKVDFTGKTVKIKVGNKSNFYAKIDNGPWISFLAASGTIDLTSVPLSGRKHSLSVAQGKDYNYVFNFQGLILDAGAKTRNPKVSPVLIEYIGDSITCGYTDAQADVSGYGWVCSEALGTEHTQIAYPGITLVSGYPKVGMDTQYFKRQSPAYPASPGWDFSKYTPKIVVINLGTNDNNKAVPDSILKRTYIAFLTGIRSKFPGAEIFVMRTFLGVKAVPTLAAVTACNTGGDNKVHYIDTNGWLTKSDYTDGLHPSINGNIKVANLLQPILSPYINN